MMMVTSSAKTQTQLCLAVMNKMWKVHKESINNRGLQLQEMVKEHKLLNRLRFREHLVEALIKHIMIKWINKTILVR